MRELCQTIRIIEAIIEKQEQKDQNSSKTNNSSILHSSSQCEQMISGKAKETKEPLLTTSANSSKALKRFMPLNVCKLSG